MRISRRNLIRAAAAAPASQAVAGRAAAAPGQAAPVSLAWLGGKAPATPAGVSWGVPWPRGAVRKEQSFRLTTAQGQTLPLQTWPLAYWPDGSLKWSGFATVAGPDAAGALTLGPGPAAAGGAVVRVRENATEIEVNTGTLECGIPRQGAAIIGSMSVNGVVVARDGRLSCSLEDRSGWAAGRTIRREDFTGSTRKLIVEQSGPVRAVVRLEGVHKAGQGGREWLPFTVRLYFYAGDAAVRLVHSIVFDGEEQKDFIAALGLAFTVPMREQVHNRHVRFSGQGDGLWSEPVQPATGRARLTMAGRPDVYAEQLAGRRIPNKEQFDAAGQKLLTDWADWEAYKLVQPTADGFTIQKRANPQCCWLEAGAGRRSSGCVFAGDVSGGLTVAVRNFWQSFPASLEVHNATSPEATVQAWLWSPDAPAMDLRHYDVRAHDLDSSYEDVQPGFSTPHGVGHTSELMLYPSAAVPAKADLARRARANQEPPLLVASPEYLHSVPVFGIWSLPDRSTAFRRAVEDQLDRAVALYQKEVEQRRWYGFWNFGDVMHAYDPGRHTWRYDIGGFAWDNTELGTDLWLWYSFLRTGRADIFRMAEAMTRHTSEVDVYHLGRFAMLGSRHNVRHWGCGAKEARISQAAYRRFYYYLTSDERTGDIMREVVNVDRKVMEIDPMRLASPRTGPLPYPGRVRGGPDWLAFAGNWMTEWERTGDNRYRDKIRAGLESMANMPYGFMTGPNCLYGYDPASGKLYPLGDDPFGTYNLQVIMGGAEVMFELVQLIDHPGWNRAWLQYCRLTNAPKEVVARDMKTGAEGADASYAGPGRLAAYAYLRTRDPAFAKKALAQMTGPGFGVRQSGPPYVTRRVEPPDVLNAVDEYPGVSTNSTAQSSLNAIQVLEMCRDQLPEEMPPQAAPPRR